MRMFKILLCITAVTFCSLFYVWQQTEIFRLAYDTRRKEVKFIDVLDKNSFLRYNLKTHTSLTRICEKIYQSDVFHLPEAYVLVKLSPSGEAIRNSDKRTSAGENIFARVFNVKRQAEAKIINPSKNFKQNP